MEEESKTEENKSQNRWKVVGYNMLALIVYTCLLRFVDGGIFIDCFLVGMHVLACLICLIAIKKWEWLLSAFLVLTIGFSTCVTLLSLGNMH